MAHSWQIGIPTHHTNGVLVWSSRLIALGESALSSEGSRAMRFFGERGGAPSLGLAPTNTPKVCGGCEVQDGQQNGAAPAGGG